MAGAKAGSEFWLHMHVSDVTVDVRVCTCMGGPHPPATSARKRNSHQARPGGVRTICHPLPPIGP